MTSQHDRLKRWWPRFSVRTVFVILTFVGGACVALLNANRLWVSVLLNIGLLLCCGAFVAAITGHGESRARWSGVAVFATLYMVASTYEPVRSQLFSSALLRSLEPYVVRTVKFGGPGNPPVVSLPSMKDKSCD
jgi:peptidoglycan/LPS O-acetylase OafA/YrhL